MEDYLFLRKNGILIYAMMWMNLKNRLSERSQTQNPHIWYCLYKLFRIGKSVRTESRLVAANSKKHYLDERKGTEMIIFSYLKEMNLKGPFKEQCFLNFNMHKNQLWILLKIEVLGLGLRFSISNKLPGMQMLLTWALWAASH